ncbi:MAG: efflux transporter outer membrane subunit, partial [Bordetella sp.]|nr:efflux transporter outer membrane subunit [Bordetella sp.]
QLRVARVTLRNSRESYAYVQQRLRLGRADVLALEQARGMVEVARTDIARREGEFARAGNALQLLLGSYPALPADDGRTDADLGPVALPEPLSSDILLQRPDIQQAEHALQAANANIGAARAAFFPSVTLSGSLASRGPGLSTLFDAASGMWSFMPKIELPIFTAGRLQANLDLAELRRDEAVAAYEKQIQTAFREVADALATRPAIAGQIEAQRRYLDALDITRERAWTLYRNGAASYLDVLSAERALFATRQNLLALTDARQANEVDLYAALGGGWAD